MKTKKARDVATSEIGTCTITWSTGNRYVTVTYPWGGGIGLLVNACGGKRKAKQWAEKEAELADSLIEAYTVTGARLLLDTSTMRRQPGGDYALDLHVADELWATIVGRTVDEAFQQHHRTRWSIAEVLRTAGIDEARARFRSLPILEEVA